MKKTTLSLFLIAFAFSVNAQVLQSENFNSLTVGNVGTDMTGLTAGQGDWFTATSNGTAPTTGTNAANTNFQIVATGFDSTNGVQITSSNGNKGSRFLWKDGLAAAWDARETGNEIFEVEYDLYTGPVSTSKAQFGVRLYGLDGTTSRVLNGFVFNMDTKVLQGVAYLNNSGTFGTYLITLQTGGLILDADTWYRIGFAYDTTTGQTTWKTDSVYTGLPVANLAGPFAVDEVDFVSSVPSTNASESSVVFDNFLVSATPVEALLSSHSNSISETAFSVYPNPTKDLVNVSIADASINTIELTDLNGRVVKSISFSGLNSVQVSTSELAQGVYMMKISSDKGSVTKKLIKE